MSVGVRLPGSDQFTLTSHLPSIESVLQRLCLCGGRGHNGMNTVSHFVTSSVGNPITWCAIATRDCNLNRPPRPAHKQSANCGSLAVTSSWCS
jgi:hypothetical protein